MKRKKIVNPCMCDVGTVHPARAFAEIVYDEGKGALSIHGVIGPMSNGNCRGSAGQCIDEIRAGEPLTDWDREMLDHFCDIWEQWHLNDMRPYCSHQKKLGWDKLANKEVTLYHYRLTMDALQKQKDAEWAALRALREGKAFTPTPEQSMFAALPSSITVPEPLTGKELEYYQPTPKTSYNVIGPTETKTLGWLRQNEHPDGLLCRPCPVCGYKYGTSWIKEDVPQDVLDWLFALPDSTVEPAWI